MEQHNVNIVTIIAQNTQLKISDMNVIAIHSFFYLDTRLHFAPETVAQCGL